MPYMMCIECDVEPVKVDGQRCKKCSSHDEDIANWERGQYRAEARERAKATVPTPADDLWIKEQNYQDDTMVLFLEGGDVKNDYEEGEHIGMKVYLQFTKIDWGTIKNDPQVERHELLLPLGNAFVYWWRRP